MEDFYRFQSREKREEKASELIKKFEEDKERVRKMKERRGRFKVLASMNYRLLSQSANKMHVARMN